MPAPSTSERCGTEAEGDEGREGGGEAEEGRERGGDGERSEEEGDEDRGKPDNEGEEEQEQKRLNWVEGEEFDNLFRVKEGEQGDERLGEKGYWESCGEEEEEGEGDEDRYENFEGGEEDEKRAGLLRSEEEKERALRGEDNQEKTGRGNVKEKPAEEPITEEGGREMKEEEGKHADEDGEGVGDC